MLNSKDFALYKKLKAKLEKEGKLSPTDMAKLTILTQKKGKGKDESDSKPSKQLKGSNDPEWYKGYSSYYDSVTNIPFNNKAGIAEQFGDGSIAKIPGCMLITGIQTIGKSLNMDAGFNYQMRLLWLDMHRKYRGIGTYESADLGCAIFTIADLFGQIERAKRVYGTLMNWNVMNRNIPDSVLLALHVNYSSITGDDLADFRANLNRIIIAAKTLCLPKGMPYIDYLLENFGNVFKDADNDKATYYVYDSDYFCCFDGTYASGSSVIYKPHTYGTGSHAGASVKAATLNMIISDLQYQLNTLLSDTDVQRMCSDFIAAYGTEGVISLTDVTEDYKVEPVKDDYRLLQLHNLKLTSHELVGDNVLSNHKTAILDNASYNWDTWRIYQEGNVLYQSLGVNSSGINGTEHVDDGRYSYYDLATNLNYVRGNALLDTWNTEVSKEEVMEMTRLTNSGEIRRYGTSTDYRIELISYGVFVPMTIQFYTHFEGTGADAIYNIPETAQRAQFIPGSQTFANSIELIACLKVDWAPFFYIASTTNAATCSFDAVLGDYVNIKSISHSNLKQLHDCAILSLFKITAVTVTAE